MKKWNPWVSLKIWLLSAALLPLETRLPSISHVPHIYKITHALKACTNKNTQALSHTAVKSDLCPVPHLCSFTHR